MFFSLISQEAHLSMKFLKCTSFIIFQSFFNHFSIESKSEALCQQPPRPDSPEVLCADNAWRDGTFGLNWNDLSEFFGNDLRTSQIYCKIIEYQIYIYSVIMLWIRFFDQWICHVYSCFSFVKSNSVRFYLCGFFYCWSFDPRTLFLSHRG